MTAKLAASKYGLDNHGIVSTGKVTWNATTAHLYEDIIRNNEGQIAHLGPVIVNTSPHTGRSANDKFVVDEPGISENVWWGKVNKPFEPEQFDELLKRVQHYLQDRELWVQDCVAGFDRNHRLPIRVITENAWHSLFARNMFIQPSAQELSNHIPEFTILHAPNFEAVPERDGTNSKAFIILSFTRNLIIIGGTKYAGEIKKSIFTVLNYVFPAKEILSMHCSANVGSSNDVALFFGLSGTGKTTLSADPNRGLIGDDEHGWSDDGVFNFEGGCYAKVIDLSKESEPEIFDTTRRFGTVLENVVYDPATRCLDLTDDKITENTRAAYPIGFIPNALEESKAGHPQNIIMLTADAFGVLPPVSRMTPEQAMYHFISGYTAKVAGTEEGVTEPTATFSACFGAPFLVWHPFKYATLLASRIKEHKAQCWLVNTGWSGGAYGVGKRMPIKYTRRLLNAVLDGSLSKGKFTVDPVFGLEIPDSCEGVPSEILQPRNTWSDKAAFDKKYQYLAGLFSKNFKQFADKVSDEVKAAGPVTG